MANVLTLIETTPAGEIEETARGLLASAASLGTPVAVLAVAPGTGGALVGPLGALGAEHVYLAET